MDNFCRALRRRYSFGMSAFTEDELLNAIVQILFYCREVDRTRICLPSPIVGSQTGVATRVIANALKALAGRPEEDSVSLKTLVVENITDDTMCELWLNPIDVQNMQKVLGTLETLMLTMRSHGTHAFPPGMFHSSLWNMVYHSLNLTALSLTGTDNSKLYDGVPLVTTSTTMDLTSWREGWLMGPVFIELPPPKLTYLELKHVSITAEELLYIGSLFGPHVEELYLTNVFLMTQQSQTDNTLSDMDLWVGLPDQAPLDRSWIAMRFRALMPKLRVCRCSYLSYKLYVEGASPTSKEFDFLDPANLGRSVSQRFVEVVMGIRQPRLLSGESNLFHAHHADFEYLTQELQDRTSRTRISDHDYHAYKLTSEDMLPDYQYSLDGQFRNCVANSIKELQYIADRVYDAVSSIGEEPGDRVLAMEDITNMMPDMFEPDTAPAG